MEIFDPQEQVHSIESKIVVALERISEVFRVLLWRETREHGLSPIQLQILLFLKHHDDHLRTVSHLALEFNVTKATISDAVKVLVQKEMLKKEPNPADARAFNLALTGKGSGVAADLGGFASEIVAPLLETGTEQKQLLLETLMTMIRSYTRSGIIQTQRMCFTCSYFDPDKQGERYCRLLETVLKREDLRLDCPEHAPLSAAG